jgi:CrcB protein
VPTLVQIALVAFGSALGGLTRWGVALWFGRWFGASFPWGTLFINVTGSMFLGWFLTVVDERLVLSGSRWLRADDLKLMVAVGFTGAYTTFSTFEFETHKLLGDGDGLAGAAYVAVSVFVGLMAVRCGVLLARLQ